VRLDPAFRLRVAEGQVVNLVLGAVDPDHPGPLPLYTPDGTRDSFGPVAPLTWTTSGLPAGAIFDSESQTIYWQTGHQSAGTYEVLFTVTDDGNGTSARTSASTRVTIEVIDLNQPPAFVLLTTQQVAPGINFSIPIQVRDPEGRPVTLVVSGLPAFATWIDRGDGTGTIAGRAAPTDRGSYVIELQASDDGNAGASLPARQTMSFVLSVVTGNLPPTIRPIGDRVALVGSEIRFTVSGFDADGDLLALTAAGLPAGATLTPSGVAGSAIFSWTPTAEQRGAVQVTFTATETFLGKAAQSVVQITVRDENAAPVFVPVPGRTINQGATLLLNLAATDSDGDGLRYGASGLPAGSTLDPISGLFSWTPTALQSGAYTLRFSVTDGAATSTINVPITVEAVNLAPVFNPLPVLTAREGVATQVQVTAVDPNADALAYFAVSLPAGATFNPATAILNWTPASRPRAMLRRGSEYGMPSARGIRGHLPPGAEYQPCAGTACAVWFDDQAGHSGAIHMPASDRDGETLAFSSSALPVGATLDPATGVFTWTPGLGQLG
jgi:hypothetical protein